MASALNPHNYTGTTSHAPKGAISNNRSGTLTSTLEAIATKKAKVTWHGHHVPLPRPLRRRLAARLAQKPYAQNMNDSPLHQLPAELLLQISKDLYGADLLSFCATSRYFSTSALFVKARNNAKSKESGQEWNRRIRRDRFHQLARLETAKHIQQFRAALCSFCQTEHSIDVFARGAWAHPANSRKCLGAVGTMRICEHRVLGFEEVQQSVQQLSVDKTVINICKETHKHGLPSYKPTHYVLRLQKDGSICYAVSHAYQLFQTGRSPVVEIDRIRGTLNDMDIYVCPHLRTSTQDLVVWLEQKAESLGFVECVGLVAWLLWKRAARQKRLNVQCNIAHCATSVGIQLPKYEDTLQLYIIRELGALENAADPKWLAQTGFAT